jgi:hypothetical protein
VGSHLAIQPTTRELAANNGVPTPWRITEIPNGISVDDVTGRQLAILYARADPNIAGLTGFLTTAEMPRLAMQFSMSPNLAAEFDNLHFSAGTRSRIEAVFQRGWNISNEFQITRKQPYLGQRRNAHPNLS